MNKQSGRIGLYLVLIVALIAGYLYLNNQVAVQSDYTYGQLEQAVTDGKVTSATIHQNSEVPTGSVIVNISGEGQKRIYVADVNEAEQLLRESGLDPAVEDVPKQSVFMNSVFPVLLTCGLIIFLMLMMNRQMSGGGGGTNAKMMNFGKSRARMSMPDDKKVTFQNVAGLEEEKEELKEVVDFLKDPQKYTKVGARIPKGVILVGPPGTGKTLLAKAVAGEAGVPFFSISGSDFVEMFVGVGASRVRDLFKQATSMAPCIIFIDEIDAIGKSRDSQYGGGNDEREQTLNQLLSEMDGFDSSKGIIILGATNRPEVLDKALLRPGRFDRRIIVEKPDLKGRVDVLKVHSHDVLMDDTVDLEEIALATSGAVGADLANMVNEAAIMAVKDGRQVVSQKDLFEAVEVVLAGKEKKDRILGEEEKKIVAYHEIGHALVATNLKHAEPVQKITIVPRTMGALGYVMQVPEEEKYLMKKEELISEIVTLMGGRAAEQVKFDDITTGASNDIEKATSIARSMVTQYGMSSKFGMMGLETIQSRYLDGRPVLNCGEVTESQIDEEVMAILNDCYKKAVECIETNQTVMDKLAEHLIEKETITGKEFVAIYEEITGEKLKRSGEEKQKEEVKELPQNEEE